MRPPAARQWTEPPRTCSGCISGTYRCESPTLRGQYAVRSAKPWLFRGRPDARRRWSGSTLVGRCVVRACGAPSSDMFRRVRGHRKEYWIYLKTHQSPGAARATPQAPSRPSSFEGRVGGLRLHGVRIESAVGQRPERFSGTAQERGAEPPPPQQGRQRETREVSHAASTSRSI
jgi:hypothetical protein